MDQLVQINIANHTTFIDDTYIQSRISCIERTTDWTSEHYLSWRSILLEKKATENKLIVRDHGDRRDDYLQHRFQILESKYQKQEQQQQQQSVQRKQSLSEGIKKSSTTTTPSNTTTTTSTNTTPSLSPPPSSSLPSSSSPSLANHVVNKIVKLEDFSFSGMHHIFDSHRKAITRIRYANNSNDLLAFSSDDGTLSLCNTMAKPPCVMATLKGHNGPIIDFAWTNDNERIMTIGVDGTMRQWSTRTGQEEKIIKDAGVCFTLCTHPIRSSIIVVSENKSAIKIYDITQGKWLSKVKSLSPVLSMKFESKGDYLFLGDDKGFIFTFKYDNKQASFSLVSKTQISSKPIVSVDVHYWQIQQKPGLSLLTNSKDSVMRVFSVKSLQTGSFVISKEYNIQAKKFPSIHSCFCPITNKREGLYCVGGGDDGAIHIYDPLRKESQSINQLMGHGSPVTDLAWNSDESHLASADSSGVVIIWNRATLK